MSRAGVVRLGRLVYPFLQQELFLPWNEDEFGEQLQDLLGRVGIQVASGLVGEQQSRVGD